MTILLPKEQHLAQAGLASLPPGWSVIELGTLLSEARGISVGVMYPGDHDPSGVPLIKVGDLGGSEINESPPFRISHQVHQEYRRTALEGGELLLTLVGAVGQCAIVPSSMKGWNAARAIAVLRFRNPEDAEFVRLCLLSEPLQYLMNAWSNTTVQTTLNLKEVRLLPLPWPGDTHERRRIAATFGCLDEKLRLNRRMNQTLEALAAAIFKAWFIDFEPVKAKAAGAKSFPSMPQPVFDALPSSLVPAPNSPSGEIPKGWEMASIAEECELVMGQSPPSEMYNETGEGLPFHQGGGTFQERFPRHEVFCTVANRVAEPGDVLFTVRAPVGRLNMADRKLIVGRGVAAIRHCRGWRSFLFHHLKNSFQTEDSIGDGTIFASVNKDDMRKIRLLRPPDRLAEAFEGVVGQLDDLFATNCRETTTLASLRDALLPKLLSGEVRVEAAVEQVGASDNA